MTNKTITTYYKIIL